MIVVDTSALIAILDAEPERDQFLDVLSREDEPLLSAVTYYEAILVAGARRGQNNVDDLEAAIETIGARIVPFGPEHARDALAAYLRYGKGIHATAKLNLCDCVAYALAKRLGAPLLFKGNDFAATDVAAAV